MTQPQIENSNIFFPDNQNCELDQSITRTSLPSGQDYLSQLEKNNQPKIAEVFSAVLKICEAVIENGGIAYVVGGCVRDLVVGGKQPKDFDLEIFGLDPVAINEILVSQFGQANVKAETGKAFGVTKVMLRNGFDIDVSLPRKDSKNSNGNGHKDFDIEYDTHMSQQEASSRRDFTMNSLSWNPLEKENNIFDYFNGVKHLSEKRLIITDAKTFGDDPLRVLRAVQFAGRHELTIDRSDIPIYQQSCQYLSALPAPRLMEEWKKLFTKSSKPSYGLKAAADLGLFNYLHPQFKKLILDNEKNHKWEQTLLAVDQAASLARQNNLPEEQTWPLLISAFCHQLPTGRPLRLADIDINNSHQQSNIEEKNNYLRLSFLDQLGIDNGTRARVTKLLSYQSVPERIYLSKVKKYQSQEIESLKQNILQNNLPDSFSSVFEQPEIIGLVNRLSALLYPATINELSIFINSISDPNNQNVSKKAASYLSSHAKKHNILYQKSPNIINYQDFKHAQVKSAEKGNADNEYISRIINISSELIAKNGYKHDEILRLLNLEPSTLAQKYAKLESLFLQKLSLEEKVKRQFTSWCHKVIEQYLITNQPQENDMREIRGNYVEQYKYPSIDKETIAKVSFYNKKFCMNFDEQNQHESDWHQFGIYSHSLEVVNLLKKLPSMFKSDQKLTKAIDQHFSQTIDNVSKQELFTLSGYLHDLGKFSARRLKIVENDLGKKVIKLKADGNPDYTFKKHELDSSKIILDQDPETGIYQNLVDLGLTHKQIEYIAQCAKLHFELGKLRDLGKKSPTGFNQKFINSELFTENAQKYITDNSDYKWEIGMFYLADSLGKYSRRLRKYRHINDNNSKFTDDDLNLELSNLNLSRTKVKNGIQQLSASLAAGKKYLNICLEDNK